jgi:mannose-6-phosphate isomerase-like protein (cupin superfamily)
MVNEPKRIEAHGFPPKTIEEFIGAAESNGSLSVARMVSPSGWSESGQTPEFDEYTIVLRGVLQVETAGETFSVRAGQAICIGSGEWVRYSTPDPEGAEYIAVCQPAFTTDTVNRDA